MSESKRTFSSFVTCVSRRLNANLLPPLAWIAVMAWFGVPLLHVVLFVFLVVLLFLLPGMALLSCFLGRSTECAFGPAAVAGLGLTTALYSVARWLNLQPLFWLVLSGLVLLGIRRGFPIRSGNHPDHAPGLETSSLVRKLGWVTVAIVGFVCFWSGRLEGGDLVYYGHLGRDPVFHLALIRQLQWSVPPANFLVSGFPFSYHYNCDLAQSLLLSLSGDRFDLHDMYYRLYPSFIYFSLGTCVGATCLRLFRSRKAAVLAFVMIVGGGDFSLLLGIVQTIIHVGQPEELLARLFQPWMSWSYVSGVLPLIHRPAYYHGMLMFFAGIQLLLLGDFRRRSWILAGVIWGLMAGFSLTLAATVGLALVVTSLLPSRFPSESRVDTASAAAAVLMASLPFLLMLTLVMSDGGRLSLVWSPVFLAVRKYGVLFPDFFPEPLTAAASLIALLAVTFGIRWAGLPAVFGYGAEHGRSETFWRLLAVIFLVTSTVGLFFRLEGGGIGGAAIGIVCLQPAVWILGLFAVQPLSRWLEIGRFTLWKNAGIWFLLVAPVIQGFPALTLSYKTIISSSELAVLEMIGARARSGDVVAFNRAERNTHPILGQPSNVHNFHVPALTRLPGYFSSDSYSRAQVDSHSGGREEYENRKERIGRIASGVLSQEYLDELRKDGVRWLLIYGNVDLDIHGIERIVRGEIVSLYEVLDEDESSANKKTEDVRIQKLL